MIQSRTITKAGGKSGAALILFGMTVFAMGQTVLFAMAGPVVREIGLTELHLGAVISLAAVAWTIGAPFWGRMSDRLGRIKPLVWGLTVYGLGTAAFALVMQAGMAGAITALTAFAALAAVRAVTAFLTGGLQPTATAYMADITDRENRAGGVAMVGAAFGLGSVLGPMVGGLLARFGVLTPLYLAAGLTVLAAICIRLAVPEPVRAADRPAPPKLSPFDPRVRFAVIFALLLFTSLSIVQQTSAFYFQDKLSLTLEQTPRAVGFAMTAMALAMLLVQAFVIRLFKPEPMTMLRFGAVLLLAGLVGALASPGLPGLIAGYGVAGLGAGLLTPGVQALASLSVSPEEQGAAAGAVAGGMGAGYIIGPLLGAGLYGGSHQWPLTAASVAALLMLAAAWIPARKPAPAARNAD